MRNAKKLKKNSRKTAEKHTVLINGELDGIDSGLGPEVVHARLESLLPGIKVHGSQLGSGW
jgi:hypothetical protein